MIGNIVDHADYLSLAERIVTSPRPLMGPVAALQLLHAPDMGQALGFSDMSSFGRSFRLWFGDTPGNLRRLSHGQSAHAGEDAPHIRV